ncbi:unnamed protein product, partial [Phaeothamnion confervicola]
WFARAFFARCWELYGRGDGYRPDLFDHPCQQWSYLQQGQLQAAADADALLDGSGTDLWGTLARAAAVLRQ